MRYFLKWLTWYTPYVTFESGILSRLGFKVKSDGDVNAILYSIQHGDSSMVTNEIMTVEQNEVINYGKADKAMYEWVLNKIIYHKEMITYETLKIHIRLDH